MRSNVNIEEVNCFLPTFEWAELVSRWKDYSALVSRLINEGNKEREPFLFTLSLVSAKQTPLASSGK